MTYRDREAAAAARVDALTREVRELEAKLAARDAEIETLKQRLKKDERQALAAERELLSLRRQLERSTGKAAPAPHAPTPPAPAPAPTPAPTPASRRPTRGSPAAWDQADRLLAEGIRLYNQGKRRAAATAFESGLELVPDHPALRRALKRYS